MICIKINYYTSIDPKQNKHSALHSAARRAHKGVLELLVKNKAKMELKDKVQ